MRIRITVNGNQEEMDVEHRELLADVLRNRLDLKGTRIGCDTSNCGACTVLIDGKAVKSCTMLAVQADGHDVMTVEGLSDGEKLHPIQEAFVQKHGMQCGYCTSGMLMTAYWLLSRNKDPDDGEIRKFFSGNLCRCTGYQDIIDSVKYASELMQPQEEKLIAKEH